jgi:hypothetical protein
MELEMAQMLENRDKRQTRRDPTEIGSNADAALLPLGGAAAGVSAEVVGEYVGERLTPIIIFFIMIQIRESSNHVKI